MDNTTLADKLEACPFCGAPAKHIERSNPMSKWRHSIDCTKCGMSGPVEATKAEAITAWHARPIPPNVDDAANQIMDLIDEHICIVWYPQENRDEFKRLVLTILAALRTPAPAPVSGDVVELLDQAYSIFTHCTVTDGSCCCGDSMENHANPMYCGHSPTDHGGYIVDQWMQAYAALQAQPAPAQGDVVEALTHLHQAEAEYRKAHDLHVDGSKQAGRAWDLMRRAGDRARTALQAQPAQAQGDVERDNAFCASVQEALKGDHTDLQKEAIILRAHRAALAAMQQPPVADDVRELVEQLDAVKRHIPMDYLQRYDVPGATGPTAALNLEAAMRDYAEDRWKLIARLSQPQADAAVAVERIVQDVCDLVPDYAEGDLDVVEISTGDLTVILERHLAAIRAGGA